MSNNKSFYITVSCFLEIPFTENIRAQDIRSITANVESLVRQKYNWSEYNIHANESVIYITNLFPIRVLFSFFRFNNKRMLFIKFIQKNKFINISIKFLSKIINTTSFVYNLHLIAHYIEVIINNVRGFNTDLG